MIRVTEADAKSPIVRVGMYFLAVTLLLCTPLGVWGTVNQFRQARASESWPQVLGTIEAAWIRENKLGNNLRGSFTAEIEYVYVVDNKTLIGKQIAPHKQEYGTREEAQKLIAPYPIRSQQPIFYNPDEPTESMLEPGVTTSSYVLLAIPPLMLAFAGLAWWVASRPIESGNPSAVKR